MADQIIPISLAGGVDTKTDDKQVTIDQLLVLENGVFETPKKIKPRFGYDSLGDSIVGGGNITLSTGMVANINTGQMVQFADSKSYAYSAVKSGFIDIGSTYSVISKNSSEVDSYTLGTANPPDMAIIGNYEIYSYPQQRFTNTNSVQLMIKDAITKNILYRSTNFQSGLNFIPEATKLLVSGSLAYEVKYSVFSPGNTFRIFISKIDPTLTAPVVSSITINRTLSPGALAKPLDAIMTPLGLEIVYYTSNNNIRIERYDTTSLALLASANVNITTFAGLARNGLTLAFDPTTSDTFLFWSTIDNLYYAVFDSALASVLALTIVNAANPFAGGINPTTFICCAALATGPNEITVISAVNNDNPGISLLSKFKVSNAAVTFTDYNYNNNAFICSKINTIGGKNYIVTGYQSIDFPASDSGQNTYYLSEITPSGLSDQNTIGNAARFLIGNAGVFNYIGTFPKPELLTNGTALISALQTISSISLRVGFQSYAVTKETFDFLSPNNTSISLVPDTNILVNGASPITIDDYAAEELFNVFPEPPTASPDVLGTVLADGTYSWYLVYEWIDAKGQIHQSSPSLPLTLVVVAPNNQFAINYYDLLNTTKRTNVAVVIYRTTANGVTAYRETQVLVGGVATRSLFVNQVPRGDNSIQSATDITPDTDITSHQILYTTGGVLPNDPMPSNSFQWSFKNRVMIGGLDDGNSIEFSKTRIEGEPIKFSSLFLLNVDISGGDVTAGGTLDDKCVFFKKNKIFYMYGEGPNDAGIGNSFSVPQEVSSPVGCQYPKSVIAMPLGLMFKSEKGIYLLDRGLTAAYIGAPVAAFNQYNVTAAIHLAKFNQVRFFLDNGTCLMYDYFVNQWSVFTGLSAIGAALYLNELTYVGSNGVVYEEDESIYLDNGVSVPMTIETPWIKLTSVQGFQRVKQVLMMMDRNSSNSITVQVAYDYESTFYQLPFQWTPVAGDEPDQVRLFLNRQKCEAIKLRISDNATATLGQGYSLSEISILVDIKRGQFKLPSTKSVGTTSA